MPAIGRLRYLERTPDPAVRARGTLVLIHAFPLNARMWEPQLSMASHGWRVVAPQLRGFDGADGDPRTASIDDYAGDVIDLLDALHVETAVIGGLSMGGYVTLAVFRHASSYFRAMILADTRSQADSPEGVGGRKRLLGVVREKGPAGVAAEMLPKLLGETTREKHPAIVESVGALMLASSGDAVAGAITALMTRPDSTPLLGAIRCPTLIIVGGEDTITPPSASEEMNRAIPGSELAIIAGAGHLSNLERPDAFNDVLARFLTHRV